MSFIAWNRGKLTAIVLFGLVGAFSASGQITLRTALDVDKDNRADFTVFRPSDATWYTLKSNGGGSAQPWGDPNDDTPTPGDYDGDQKGDISVFRDSTGYWYTINSSNNTVTGIQWGTAGDEPVARDYDKDGKTDPAVVRRSNNKMTWYILGSTAGGMAVEWGVPTDFAVPGDFDGDGKFDFAVQRPQADLTAPATFYILTATGAGSAIQFGRGKDIVAPGDYDGDGKTDIAVIREGNDPADPLVWTILNSRNGNVTSVAWGATGTDYNVQNDYDGDGITDIAIWRDTTGDFWVIRSTDGGFLRVTWGTHNDFPVAGHDTH